MLELWYKSSYCWQLCLAKSGGQRKQDPALRSPLSSEPSRLKGPFQCPSYIPELGNDLFRDVLDQFLVIFLDDIFIFLGSQSLHNPLLVLEQLQVNGLYRKCEVWPSFCQLLRLCHWHGEIGVGPWRESIIVDWEASGNFRDVQCFLGLANFCQRFIKDFLNIIFTWT